MELERQYKVCNFGLKAEIRWSLKWRGRSAGLSSEGRDSLVTQANLSVPRVCSPSVALLHKKDPRPRRKICANSLGLCSYYTQSSPSKNKNMIYIFIYLRVLRCLSCDAIYDIYDLVPVPAEFLQGLITNLVIINDSTGRSWHHNTTSTKVKRKRKRNRMRRV